MANYIHVPEGAPAVPKLDVTVDEQDFRAGALKLIKELRPSWKPSEVKMKVVNVNYSPPHISHSAPKGEKGAAALFSDKLFRDCVLKRKALCRVHFFGAASVEGRRE